MTISIPYPDEIYNYNEIYVVYKRGRCRGNKMTSWNNNYQLYKVVVPLFFCHLDHDGSYC
jgi:hypothetical protein